MPDSDGTVTPAQINITPELDENDNVILSEEVRKQQKDEGYVPDVQPKAVPPAMVPATGVVGTETGGAGAMQPTGNIMVAAAVQTPVEPEPEPEPKAATTKEAKKS
jgi:hypothetical protein